MGTPPRGELLLPVEGCGDAEMAALGVPRGEGPWWNVSTAHAPCWERGRPGSREVLRLRGVWTQHGSREGPNLGRAADAEPRDPHVWNQQEPEL